MWHLILAPLCAAAIFTASHSAHSGEPHYCVFPLRWSCTSPPTCLCEWAHVKNIQQGSSILWLLTRRKSASWIKSKSSHTHYNSRVLRGVGRSFTNILLAVFPFLYLSWWPLSPRLRVRPLSHRRSGWSTCSFFRWTQLHHPSRGCKWTSDPLKIVSQLPTTQKKDEQCTCITHYHISVLGCHFKCQSVNGPPMLMI